MPLEPATDVQLIAYGAIKIPGVGPPVKNVTEIKGVYVNTGTKPAGSTWIRNPIPACYGPGKPIPVLLAVSSVSCVPRAHLTGALLR